jgi:hypothetical protein
MQGPSKHDIKTSGTQVQYVFGRRSGLIYLPRDKRNVYTVHTKITIQVVIRKQITLINLLRLITTHPETLLDEPDRVDVSPPRDLVILTHIRNKKVILN